MSPLTSALGSVSINQLPSELPPSEMGGKMERERRRQTGIPPALRSLLPVVSLPLVRFGSGSVDPVPPSPDQPTSGLFNS